MIKTLVRIRISTMAQQVVDRSMSKRPFGWILFCKTTKVPSTFYLKETELRKAVKRVCRGYYKNKRKVVMSGLKKKKKKHMEDKT